LCHAIRIDESSQHLSFDVSPSRQVARRVSFSRRVPAIDKETGAGDEGRLWGNLLKDCHTLSSKGDSHGNHDYNQPDRGTLY
jgi:hypothetical protein